MMGSLRQICERQIKQSLLNEFTDYINPDTFYCQTGAVPFVYTTDHVMYYGADNDAHYEIIGRHKELVDERYDLTRLYKYENWPTWDNPNPDFRPRKAEEQLNSSEFGTGSPRDSAIDLGDLVGRVGRKGMAVSFWNEEMPDYGLLPDCLKQLIADGHLKPNASISTPVHGLIPMAQLSTAQAKALSPEESEKMELYKQLHLMRGQEKHNAMKKLGLGGGGTPHPIQKALTNNNLRSPGQRWWAPNSESFKQHPNKIVTETDFNAVMRGYDDNVTFVMLPTGRFLWGHGRVGHTTVALDNIDKLPPEWRSLIEEDNSIVVEFVQDECTCGRFSPKHHMVAFWATDVGRRSDMIIECVQRLVNHELIDENWIVCLSDSTQQTVGDCLLGNKPQQGTVTDFGLYKELHSMTGAKKQDAMKQLGLGGESKPHPVQKAMRDSGLQSPGQKWWAPNSESFNKRLNVVIDGLV